MDPHPTAEDKSVTPATDPSPDAPQSLAGWFRQNGVQLAIVIAIIEFLWDGWRPHSAVLGRVEHLAGYHDISRHPQAHLLPESGRRPKGTGRGARSMAPVPSVTCACKVWRDGRSTSE